MPPRRMPAESTPRDRPGRRTQLYLIHCSKYARVMMHRSSGNGGLATGIAGKDSRMRLDAQSAIRGSRAGQALRKQRGGNPRCRNAVALRGEPANLGF